VKVQPITGHEGREGGGTIGDGCSTPHPGRFTLGKTPGTHCTGSCVGPRLSGRARKISPPPEFDPPTVQRVAIRTTHSLSTSYPTWLKHNLILGYSPIYV